MKHYLKTYKLIKSFVVTGVLSFGLMSGGQFTAAAGLDKAKVEPVKAVQAVGSQNGHANEKKVETPIVPAETEIAVQPAEEVEADAQPIEKVKTEVEHKEEGSIGKSQASIHASETAKMHASENSAIYQTTSESQLEESTTTAETAGYLFGSDSASSANPAGEDFYIGKLGYGSTVQFDANTGGAIYFSSARAQSASYVYGYWFLSGMQTAPEGISASDWGAQQAKLALESYEAMKSVYGSKVRPVIFIDVESAYTGLSDYDYANNHEIYNAFVNYLNQYGQGVKPGTYSSPGNWDRTMGDFSPNTPGAYWVAYYPGDIPSDLTTSNSYWVNFPGTTEKAEIWQYYGGYDDYNVAWKLP
ncbi:hypothetical protein ACFPA1_27150 [Neobacillus sp. GCM10023253]|uniref:hypothetical protein n=1 Tax=Neobacillus sp. GCM10023253 TaxID=3252644 RepID=UPI003620EC61